MHRSKSFCGRFAVTRTPTAQRRLLWLLGELCNGTLSEQDGDELDRLLVSASWARAEYAKYMAMHACLYSEAPSLCRTAVVPGPDVAERSPAPRSYGRRWMAYAIAAGLAGVALVAGLDRLASSSRDQTTAGVDPDDAASAPLVARITGTHNCRWDTPGSDVPVGFGSQLLAGQRLTLLEGVAEITFNDGATLLLEGPADMMVGTSGELSLDSGRVAAVVPNGARGFRLRTAALDVYEVAAEFGLYAQPSGATELHVFNGTLQANALDEQGRANRQLELKIAEAARVNPVSTTVVEFPADERQFVRSLLPQSGPRDGLLAYEGFRYPGGPLAAQNGGFGWAGPWFTIAADESIGPGSNRVAPGSLTVEGVVPTGNRAALTAQRNRIRRSLATSVGGVFDAAGLVENQDGVRLVGRDGTAIYLSFLQRVTATGDGFYGLELHRGDGNANRVLSIGHGAEGSGYAATSNVNVYGPDNGPTLGREDVEANFFVVKIAYGVDNKDSVLIYRNPASLKDEQACEPVAELRGNFAFDRISIANFDGKKTHEIDELRLGTHFLAVTGRWGAGRGQLLRQITKTGRQTQAHSLLAYAESFNSLTLKH